MRTIVCLLVVSARAVAAGGVDMSETFAKLKTCQACTKAGYGWCPLRRRCGGFANKNCGVGPDYVAEDFVMQRKRAPPSPPPGTTDMRAIFAKLRDCGSCVQAGYGWCPLQRKCGGFANRECGIGPNYVAADAPPARAAAPRNGLYVSEDFVKQRKRAPPSPPPGTTDMRAIFAKLRDCGSCVQAGYGWCPLQRKCGGFANSECGIGPNYVAADAPPARAAAPRNGLWESKRPTEDVTKAAAVNAPPAAEVPPAASPPPASMLYAGPASPPPLTVEVAAADADATVTVAAGLSNATSALDVHELMQLPQQALVSKILALQSQLSAAGVAA